MAAERGHETRRNMMQVSFAGKGGSGKTTISATVARTLARRGHTVRAIDADSNPNLAIALGIPAHDAIALQVLPKEIARRDTEGKRVTVLLKEPPDLFQEFGVDAPDGIRLLVGSRVGHAGSG
jgi:CO dehydrogenase maturation factor